MHGIIGTATQYWGQPQHMHIHFDKILLFGFPYFGGAVVITAELYVPLTAISEIQEILKESCK